MQTDPTMMTGQLEGLLTRLEELLAEVEAMDDADRRRVFELLDGIDALHRMALGHLVDALGAPSLQRLRDAHPAVAWLLDAYGAGVDEAAAAEEALESVRPYVHSHGGRVEVLDAADGVVRVRLSGACSGCTASAVTLREGVEKALREGFLGFARLEVEEDDAPSHPPPGATLLQVQSPPR